MTASTSHHLTQFSAYCAADFRYMLPVSPSKERAVELRAVAVQRANDNAGTFLVNEDMYPVAYVPNSADLCGVWAYYSDAVARHYGLRYFADAPRALAAA